MIRLDLKITFFYRDQVFMKEKKEKNIPFLLMCSLMKWVMLVPTPMHTEASLFTHGYICLAVYIALLMNGFHKSIWSLCSDFTNDGAGTQRA